MGCYIAEYDVFLASLRRDQRFQALVDRVREQAAALP
jgi:hypothetical protein